MSEYKVIDGNYACSHISYLFTEVAGIYPITPSSKMPELIEKWAIEGRLNLFDNKVKLKEMQSEAGAAALIHGSLLSGSLSSTYTSSQGLLLMIPEMYKIAGELLPCVINVASRTVATHALSIFGDHSDIYAVRSTGFAIMASSSVNDVQYMTLLSYLCAIEGSVPFVNFFDGFRTSHELNKVKLLDYEDIKELVNFEKIDAFKNETLLNSKIIKGTAQNEDIYFQNLEVRNDYYEDLPDVVNSKMKEVNKKFKTDYKPFNYYGDPNAKRVIVAMGSVCDTIKEAIKYSEEKLGLIEVHLFRPFSEKYFLDVLPKTCTRIAVLERYKETTSREAMYLDINNIIKNNKLDIEVVGGRYGISSKNTNINDILSVYDNLGSSNMKDDFTIGILDDVSNKSLPKNDSIIPNSNIEMIIYGYGSDGMNTASKNLVTLVGENTDLFVQEYGLYDSRKSGGVTREHIRIGKEEIKSPYYIETPHIVVCSNDSYLKQYDILSNIKENGIFILNTSKSIDEIDNNTKAAILKKKLRFYTIDASKIAKDNNIPGKISYIMEAAIIKIIKIYPYEKALEEIIKSIENGLSSKGEDIVNSNISSIMMVDNSINTIEIESCDSIYEEKSYEGIINNVLHLKGDTLPVSEFLIHDNGTYDINTSRMEKRDVSSVLPCWNSDKCISCNKCSLVCPHGVIRPKLLTEDELRNNPNIKYRAVPGKDLYFAMEFSYEDCLGCSLCSSVCPTKAIEMNSKNGFNRVNEKITKVTKKNVFPKYSSMQIAYNKPLFKYSGACAGCGEAPYIKLLTQVVGEGMVIANATGCSSIYGGSSPTSPYSVSWANSLFEDNAEFGLGIRVAEDLNRKKIFKIMKDNLDNVSTKNKELFRRYLDDPNNYKNSVIIKDNIDYDEVPELLPLKEYIPNKSVWIIGGDGWSYDIGFSGIDHVIASNENVNILVLDNEIYSNTGGQTSKSSNKASISKFSSKGKKTSKKDLAKIFMNYDNVYVAQVCLGANIESTISAFKEANEHVGPSIIIAYAPCILHGIKGGMKNSLEEEKLIVRSGYFPIFRYNKSKNEFKLDYKNVDFNLYTEVLKNETRYKMIAEVNPKNAKRLLIDNINSARERFNYYLDLENKLTEEVIED